MSSITTPAEPSTCITPKDRCHFRWSCKARFSGGATSLRGFADAILRGLRLEPVALAGHCLDELRRAPVVAELHSQLADVTVDDVALDLELAAPDARQELLAAQHRARVCREQVEQGLLDRSERKVLIADTDPLFDEVDLETVQPDLGHEGDLDAVDASHERVRPCDDLIEREGHLDDVVDPPLERTQFERGVALSGEREDRDRRHRLLAVEQVDEIWVDVEVDKGELRLPFADQLAAFGRIDSPPGLVEPVLKRQRDEVADGLAHDDQDPGSRTSFTPLALPPDCRHSSGVRAYGDES